MSPIKVDPVSPEFVAVIRDVDLAGPPDRDTVEAVERAIWKYGVLIFPDQPLTQEEQVGFASLFGPLYTGLQMKILKNFNKRMRHEALSDISNLDADGEVVDPNSAKGQSAFGTMFWHTDAAYENHPFRYSILLAINPASRGGETQFADLRAAYDSLDEETKRLIEQREATFYSHHTRHVLGFVDSDALLRDYPPVRWPLVRVHPGSGRKLLWVDTRVTEISGMSVPQGRALANELVEHAGQREHVYTHKWTANDVVMWDNRSVLHRMRRFDLSEKREMRRVATIDNSSPLGLGKLPSYIPDSQADQPQSEG